MLDVDGTEGLSLDAATSIDRSLQKIDSDNGSNRSRLKGYCTDAGGGGTGVSMGKKLLKKGCPADFLLFSTCVVHGLHCSLTVPVKELCGKAGAAIVIHSI